MTEREKESAELNSLLETKKLTNAELNVLLDQRDLTIHKMKKEIEEHQLLNTRLQEMLSKQDFKNICDKVKYMKVTQFHFPAFIFPCIRYKDLFLVDGPPESVKCGNASRWMQEEEFVIFLKHFVKHTKVTSERKVLLLLDNHSLHLSVQAVNYCKENGIVLLTFPPHCSHKLQLLDRSMYGPFKKMINTASDTWMRMNPAKTMTIYDIPSLVKAAFPNAATPSNIQAGFGCTGIWPFNPDIFQECDYAPSQVTDRPDPSASLATSAQPGQAFISANLAAEASTLAKAQGFCPSAVRAFPKAGVRKNPSGKRKKLQSEILTETHTTVGRG